MPPVAGAGATLAGAPVGAVLAGGSSTTIGAPTTTPKSPYVTLQSPSPSGGIPGDATDPLDFFGILIAVVVIAAVIIAVRLVFRGRGRVYEEPRDRGGPDHPHPPAPR